MFFPKLQIQKTIDAAVFKGLEKIWSTIGLRGCLCWRGRSARFAAGSVGGAVVVHERDRVRVEKRDGNGLET